MSESSDEPLSASYNRESFIYSRENSLSAYGSESTISEGDEGDDHPKKSVSFSSHVDRTMYKSGASVSALHATLKNKKKRQKKRDQRIHDKEERRRRRTSSGGSYSDSVSDPEEGNVPEGGSVTMFDMDSAQEPVFVAGAPTETQSDSQSEGSQQPVHKGKKSRSKKNKNRGKRNVQLASAHSPPETSTSEGSQPNGTSEEEASSSAMEPESPTGDVGSGPPAEQPLSPASSVEGDQAPPSLASTPKKSPVQLVRDAGPDSDDDEPAVSGPKDNGCGSEPPSEKPSSDVISGEGTMKEGAPDQPDTMLSWEDGTPPGEELTTQCAFEFQNSMMYELDE